jgi:sialate O-acetylesterase
MKGLCVHTCFLLLFVLANEHLMAQLPLQLPGILSDHAVLQKNARVRLWGKGPGSFELKIVASWNPQDTVKLLIGPECSWSVPVQTPEEKGPHTITFICGNQVQTITDVLMGDVWLCAGQSNMEFNYGWGINNADSNYRVSTNNGIRFFEVEKNYDNIPVSECRGKWVICDAATASKFSTIGYFFGRNINEHINTPIGLIGSYWGGTNIQAWMPADCFNDPKLTQTTSYIEPYGWAPKGVAVLYNAMIYPLHNFTIKGCIWYQGEANVDWNWDRYANLLKAMVQSWRNVFDDSFYFYAVQIAPWNGYGNLRAAVLREQIANAGKQISRYGSIGIMDLVPDVSDIHPGRKKEVGIRLSNLVLREVYNRTEINAYPPYIVKVDFKDQSALVAYNASGALRSTGAHVSGFQLAGPDSVFYPAKALLLKDKRIKVFSEKVTAPVSLRYCFENTSIPDLFDHSGLPLQQFRTDAYLIY